MSGSLFSNITKMKTTSLFPSNVETTQTSGTSLFGTSSSSKPSLFSVSVAPTLPTPSIPSCTISPVSPTSGISKESPVIIGRRRQSSAVSQISRKYSRLHSSSGRARRRTSDEHSSATSDLRLCDLPRHINTADGLRTIFSQFGKIERVMPNRLKCMAIIHFKSVESAKAARENGRNFEGMEGVAIYFHKRTSRKVENSLATQRTSQKAVKRTIVGNGQESSRASKTVKIESVKSLKGTVASSATERLSVLDRHDALIRAAIGKLSNPSRMDAVCPDMCPERERYARQEQHRLSIFEVIPGSQPPQVDHKRAVKEYSRSSADQETPLPHELRPLPVLARTMRYLLMEIADACVSPKLTARVGWGEWFDFLWNRTRAIRKEVTQQRLCNVSTAAIVEQTSRFHIFAAARLCELPVDEFDQKINDENLTKCLQTLKEIYHDLSLSGSRSPNEAEFRSFMILRNLNDTNTLNDVTQLDPEIRSSSDVRLALDAYFALSNNNYTRFFKVVRQASFLQACLLHRCFNQVRWKALNIMIRAYTPPGKANNVMPFPLHKLVDQLAFESIEAAVSFCGYHGLKCSEDAVIFTRSAVTQATESLPIRRALKFVESKLGDRRIGDVLNGGTLPIHYELQEVRSSFNSGNVFIGSNVDVLVRSLSEEEKTSQEENVAAEDEDRDDHEQDVFAEGESGEEEMADEDDEWKECDEEEEEEEEDDDDDDGTDILDDELEEGEIREPISKKKLTSVVAPRPEPPASFPSASSFVKTSSCQDVLEQLLSETLHGTLTELASNVISTIKARRDAAEALGMILLNEVIQENVVKEAVETIQDSHTIARAKSDASVDVLNSLCTSVVEAECRNVSGIVLRDFMREQSILSETIDEVYASIMIEAAVDTCRELVAEEKLRLHQMKKAFRRWVSAVRQRRLRRDALLLIAAGPPLEHSRLIARRLFGEDGPKPTLADTSASVTIPTPGERFMNVVNTKNDRFYAPLSSDDFPLEDGYRLIFLLGRNQMSLFLTEWLFSKLDNLQYIEPIIVSPNGEDVRIPGGLAVVGLIAVGCAIPRSLRNLPTLTITENESFSDSMLGPTIFLKPNNSSTWQGQLEVGLSTLLTACRKHLEEAKWRNKRKPLSLSAFLDLFFHSVIFETLIALQSARSRQQLVDPPAHRLLSFYESSIGYLRRNEAAASNVIYRFTPLLELSDPQNFLNNDKDKRWSETEKKVDQFMHHQHLSHRCRAECAVVMQQSYEEWREMARDYDLHQHVAPPAEGFPWIRLFLLWISERTSDVIRQCINDPLLRNVEVDVDVAELHVREASKLGQTLLLGPPNDREENVETLFKKCLEKARVRKWGNFAKHLGCGDERKSLDLKECGHWEKLCSEMRELRTSMSNQLDESLHLSQLFVESS